MALGAEDRQGLMWAVLRSIFGKCGYVRSCSGSKILQFLDFSSVQTVSGAMGARGLGVCGSKDRTLGGGRVL